MSDINIRITGSAGRITLTRPKALNALSYDMCLAIDAALKTWRHDDQVQSVIIDAEGDRAFCAGGDIAELYDTGKAGNYDYGRGFWTDEYRMNARIFEYPKPVVSFLQGFTMGGGVGIGCHGTHRVVGNSSQISMPEAGIGLIPDVGGTLLLTLAPGRLGEYLGLTAGRMKAADAIYAGFADFFISEENWPELIAQLEQGASPEILKDVAQTPKGATLPDMQADIDRCFGGETLSDILTVLRQDDSDFAAATLKIMNRNSPLSMACTTEMLHRLRGDNLSIRRALELEYRFTYRAMEQGDFIEGVRAQIIDKDRNPNWKFADQIVSAAAVANMLLPLGASALTFEKE